MVVHTSLKLGISLTSRRNSRQWAVKSRMMKKKKEEEESHDDDWDYLAEKERKRVEAFVESRMNSTKFAYPQFQVYIKSDHRVAVRFDILDTTRNHELLIHIVQHLGSKEDDYGASVSSIDCRASSTELVLNPSMGKVQDYNKGEALSAGIVESHAIELVKIGRFSPEELKVVASTLKKLSIKKDTKGSKEAALLNETVDPIKAIKAMGVSVFGVGETCGCVTTAKGGISWDNIAGYEEQKGQIEETIVLSQCSDAYDTVPDETRTTFEPNRPRTVLLEGPPGTGKTSCAIAIGSQSVIPLVYVPLKVFTLRYYTQSEKALADLFSLAKELPNGSLFFLDELESIAMNSCTLINEATCGALSLLLHKLVEQSKLNIIAATNSKENLDPSFIRLFDSIITFDLPKKATRKKIIFHYAKHLTESELSKLVKATYKMSGRDIREVCHHTERLWASKIVRGEDGVKSGDLPHIEKYLYSAQIRRNNMNAVEACFKHDNKS